MPAMVPPEIILFGRSTVELFVGSRPWELKTVAVGGEALLDVLDAVGALVKCVMYGEEKLLAVVVVKIEISCCLKAT